MKLRNIWGHFRTITMHKFRVMEGCFRVGLYKQGLLHDLSKYSPEEFIPGVIYYQGNRSPNAAEREARGFSAAWLHHKGRNKHHYEYWIDFTFDAARGMAGNKMPLKYVIEMMMDRIAASKTYLGKEYTDAASWEYYVRVRKAMIIAPETDRLLRKLLTLLKEKGEKTTFSYMRFLLKRGGY